MDSDRLKHQQEPLERDQSRDPISGEPDSHPVAAGAGATGGGLAGAAIGAVLGGPIGAGVGIVAGSLAGGSVGAGAAESGGSGEGSSYGGELRDLIGYAVVDRDDEKVGTVDCLYQDSDGQPAFIGVKTGWLGMGKAHIVPAHQVRLTEQGRKVKLPYSVEQVKNAPTFDADTEITPDLETQVYTYYEGYGLTGHRREPVMADQPDIIGQPEPMPQAMREPVAQDRQTLELKEERLQVGTRSVEAGGVRLRKVIRTETVNQPVEVTREEVVIERVPAGERAATSGASFDEQEIYVPLRREVPVVAKETVVREEVQVRKTEAAEQQQVSETIRSEDVEIEDTRPANERSPTSGSRPFPSTKPTERT